MLQINIDTYKLADLPELLVNCLRAMTLNRNSYMIQSLDNKFVFRVAEVSIAWLPKTLYPEIGWSMVRPYQGRKLLQVFVRPEFRRLGVGTRLAAAFNSVPDLIGVAWDSNSQSFFNQIRLPHYWK